MFWKFNSFIGSVGFVLLIAAFFAGDQVVTLTLPEHMSSAVWVAREPLPIYLAYGAAFCLVWQLALTVVGFICSFFATKGDVPDSQPLLTLEGTATFLWYAMCMSFAVWCATVYLNYQHMIPLAVTSWSMAALIFVGTMWLGIVTILGWRNV